MRNKKWTLEEQSSFLKLTGELLARGYPLAEALDSVSFHLPVARKKAIQEGLSQLREGYSFYQILSKWQFHEHLIGYVYFAEQHGGLSAAFLEGSEMMKKHANDIAKLKKLVSYPLFLIFSTIILFFFVQHYLLPRFSSLFSSMNVENNVFTIIVYQVSDGFPIFLFVLAILCTSLLSYYVLKFRKKAQLEQKYLLSKIPIIGRMLRLFYTHYFSVQFSYLLQGGVSISDALSMFEQNEQQPFYREVGQEIKRRLRAGDKLETILLCFAFFERDLAMIVRHGQDNGRLDQELNFFAKNCLSSLEEGTEKYLKLVQPILYSIMGFMIISMYLAVLLPMFHLLDGI